MQDIRAHTEHLLCGLFTQINKKGFSIPEDKIWRIEFPVEKVDLIQWLSLQPFREKLYWKDRHGGMEIAGAGLAKVVSGNRRIDYSHLFDHLHRFLAVSDKDIRYFGGFVFDQTHLPDRDWEPFAKYRFCVPEFEILSKGDKQWFAHNFVLNGEEDLKPQFLCLKNQITKLQPFRQLGFNHLPDLHSRKDFPDWHSWKENVLKVLDLFEQDVLKKVVLARKSVFTFNEELNPIELLHLLAVNNFQAFHFYFQLEPNYAFLGITPEQLYKRNGNNIFSEAIAGTRPRGQSDEEDSRLGQELLASEKDLREHRCVSDTVKSSLKSLCHSIDVLENDTLLKLHHVQHLYTHFHCLLKEEVRDGEILAALHPTPAVGGFPREQSMLKITEMEPFDRGWYAGPVGWISRDAAEFVVAIRSALARGKTLSLFAGSGIVKGSQPEAEWEENENKILNFSRLFYTSDQ